MACPDLLVCPFYNNRLRNMPGGANLQKLHYCENRSDKCARSIVANTLGLHAVPDDLLPYDVQSARKMIFHFMQKRRQSTAR